MKTKIKFQRHEMQAYYYMLQNTLKSLSSDYIVDYLNSFEINKMAQSCLNTLIYNVNKKQFTVTFNDYQTICMINSLFKSIEFLEPLQKSIAHRVLENIDQQFNSQKQLLYNFQEKKETLLLEN